MKALKITIGALGVVAMLAVPATTMAAPAPAETNWQFKDGYYTGDYDKLPNPVAKGDAQITHNGWAVGGNKHTPLGAGETSGGDQTHEPGSRADLVQFALGHADSY
jgi:hypothetical protein